MQNLLQNLVKTPEEIEVYRVLGQKLKRVKELAFQEVVVGARAWDLTKKVEAKIKELGATPCFKGYQGFPEAVCVSVNEVMIHGVPNKHTTFQAGDLVKVDIGIAYKGLHGDTAFSKSLGTSQENESLIECAKKACWAGIKTLRDGVSVAEVEEAIFKVIKTYGFLTTKLYSGHGIGKKLHEEPAIFNIPFLKQQKHWILRKGMVVCIEPMLLQGDESLELLSDGWSVRAANKRKTAHWEEMALITKESAEVLS